MFPVSPCRHVLGVSSSNHHGVPCSGATRWIFIKTLCLARSGSRSEARRRIIHLFIFPLVFKGLALIFPAVVKTEFCSAVGETL